MVKFPVCRRVGHDLSSAASEGLQPFLLHLPVGPLQFQRRLLPLRTMNINPWLGPLTLHVS